MANNTRLKNNYKPTNALTNYFLTIMVTIFPVFFTDFYFNIRHDKYYFFLICSGVFFVSQCIFLASEPIHRINSEAWYKKLSVTDYSMIAFIIVCSISTFFSEAPKDAFFGTMGRNNGLLLMLFYAGVYFFVSRTYRYKDYVLIALSVVLSLTSILAVLNVFFIDPLHMFYEISDKKTIENFISTFGNKNIMTSYVCLALPVVVVSFIQAKHIHTYIIFLIASMFGFMGLMAADSMSGILGFSVVTIVLFIYYIRKIYRLKRFFLVYTAMLFAAKLMRYFSYSQNDVMKVLSDVHDYIVFSRAMYLPIVLFAIITIALYVLSNLDPKLTLPKVVTKILIISFSLIAVIIFMIGFYFSVADKKTNLGAFNHYLRFNDAWGTHRGFMWIRSIWIFQDFPVFNKLFGCGPDNFYMAFKPYFDELTHYGDSSTNSAHNEYLNYLVTTGALGLISYLGFVCGGILSGFRSAIQRPYVLSFTLASLCYAVQAIVNIAQPISTPLFILFLAICEAANRKNKHNN